MTSPEAIFAAAVLFVGIPAMLRNWTAAALVASWFLLQAAWQLTGESSSMLELICDYGVLVVIFTKRLPEDCGEYRSLWHQLSCLITRRSPGDMVVVAAFPVMWALYIAQIDPYYRWWGLWWLALIQLLAAGCEGLVPVAVRLWSRLTHSGSPPHVMRLGLAGHG